MQSFRRVACQYHRIVLNQQKCQSSLPPEALSNPNKIPNSINNNWPIFNDKLNNWMKRYEDFVGLTEVKAAQARVLEAEKRFVDSQDKRRETQQHITAIQQRLRDLHAELDRTARGEDKYLTLITQEHAVIKEERMLKDAFSAFEKDERENFAFLSHAVRDSHEKERAQAEKTKYWSILGSVIGTFLGVVGTTINNRLRMKELRSLVSDSHELDTKEIAQGVASFLTVHLVENPEWVKKNNTALVAPPPSNLLHHLDRQHEVLSEQLRKLTLIAGGQKRDSDFDLPLLCSNNDLEMLIHKENRIMQQNLIFTSVLLTLATLVILRWL